MYVTYAKRNVCHKKVKKQQTNQTKKNPTQNIKQTNKKKHKTNKQQWKMTRKIMLHF
jgi:hypothetical protein